MKVLVNVITTFRFVYTLFLPFLHTRISKLAFLISIALVFLTDSIDGTLARKFKVQTIFGSTMDTIADKTLSIVLMFLLIKKVPIISLMLVGEIIIAVINIYFVLCGKKTKSSLIGKLKMWFLGISIILGFMNYFDIINYKLVIIATFITGLIQIVTIIDYIVSLTKQQEKNSPFYPKEKHNLTEILFSTDYYLKQYKI